jgi:hypothetical protein
MSYKVRNCFRQLVTGSKVFRKWLGIKRGQQSRLGVKHSAAVQNLSHYASLN